MLSSLGSLHNRTFLPSTTMSSPFQTVVIDLVSQVSPSFLSLLSLPELLEEVAPPRARVMLNRWTFLRSLDRLDKGEHL